MNTRKRSIVFGLLVAFALWPIVHHVMTRSLDLNPWKYGGWAMYAVPVWSPEIALFAMRDEAFVPLTGVELDDQSRAQMFLLLTQLASERRAASPDSLGQSLLAAVADAKKVRIQLRFGSLDPESHLVLIENVDYDYVR